MTFTVIGVPAPQGSKTKWGTEDNPRTKPWRATVAAQAAATLNGDALLAGPLSVDLLCVLPRPKSHYGSGRNANVLKPAAPVYVSGKPDLDKLQRAIGDALSGVLFRDDSQIAEWRTRKVYGNPARAEISVRPL